MYTLVTDIMHRKLSSSFLLCFYLFIFQTLMNVPRNPKCAEIANVSTLVVVIAVQLRVRRDLDDVKMMFVQV